MRANAQATLNSANATLSAAQTQAQNNANVIAAQIAATAEIVRANAQATLNCSRFNAERRADPGCDPADPDTVRTASNTGSGDTECRSHADSTK